MDGTETKACGFDFGVCGNGHQQAEQILLAGPRRRKVQTDLEEICRKAGEKWVPAELSQDGKARRHADCHLQSRETRG
jgi:hypothetical protein